MMSNRTQHSRARRILNLLGDGETQKVSDNDEVSSGDLNSGPSTSRSRRVQSTVNYRISVSSNEDPFSPPVSEYLPSLSPSPIREFGSTLPSSLLNDFNLNLNEDCMGSSVTLLSTPTSTTRNDLLFIASPTVVFVCNPQKTISINNNDSYHHLEVLDGDFIEGINLLPNNAGLEPVSRLSLGQKTTKETTSPERTLPALESDITIVPDTEQSLIGCHYETLPIENHPTEQNTSTEAEATTSHPALVTEANINPRKRKRNPEKWSKEQKKCKRNVGQEPQKQMKDPCKCKLKCFEKIPSDNRNELFKNFWALGQHENQWHFILRNIELTQPKVMKIQRSRQRNRTLVYYLPLKNDTGSMSRLKVCKTMFLNTLDINERMVYTAIDKYSNGDPIADLRGKHANRPHRTASDSEKSVIQHIQSFPCIESHYLRKKTSRQFLSQDLNISKMHRLYKEYMSENENFRSTKVASEYQYNQIFNTQFNLSFFRPKKDLCSICSKYDNATEEGKLQLKENYDSHIKNKNTIRNIKNTEKESADPTVKTVAVFDLEKVLSLPQSNVGIFHYKRKYPAYNFTVFNLLSRQGFCYLWHAQIAKRGANEIASCLYHFIESEVNRGITTISLFSDNCSGQNRNRFIFSMYIYVTRLFNVEINHRFLQTGHTQNEGDSMHACVEKNMKNKTLYSPDQLYEVIMNSKVQNKYIIKEMAQNDFYDFKCQVTTNKNWSHDTNGNKIFFSKIKEIKTSTCAPNKLLFKYDFDSNEYLVLDTTNRTSTRKRKTAHVNAVGSDELQHAYTQLLPISNALYKDLIDLCNSNAIPPHYQTFYRSLRATEAPLEVLESSEEE